MTNLNNNHLEVEPSEFEVHSEAYQRLKNEFKYVRGGLQLMSEEFDLAIFDIAILNNFGNIILVVEVKKNKRVKRKGKQKEKYERLANCPCIYILGMEQAVRVVETVKRYLVDMGYTTRDIQK